MKRVIVGLVAIGVFLTGLGSVPASSLQRIELKDGTVLRGQILSFDGSTYSIRTESVGIVRIEKAKVRSIQMEGSGQQGVQDFRSKIMANPEALRTIMELQNDPDVQAVLNDPEIMEAAEAGDLNRLLSNPKFLKLLQNPVIQEIGKSLLK